MSLQLADPFSQQADVFHQAPDLIANLVSRFAHAGILLVLLNKCDRQHEKRWRYQNNVGAIRFLHHIVEAVVDLGVDRFRRYEHQRQLLSLARDQIFAGDVADVLSHVGAQPLGCGFAFVIGFGVAIGSNTFERELGVDH
jgi:hypothetical protein